MTKDNTILILAPCTSSQTKCITYYAGGIINWNLHTCDLYSLPLHTLMYLSWQKFMVKQLWEYRDKCVWKNRLSCYINLLSSTVQWSITTTIFSIDVDFKVVDQIFHHLQFTLPEVTWTKRHAMDDKFDHAVVDECVHTYSQWKTITLCAICTIFNTLINEKYN